MRRAAAAALIALCAAGSVSARSAPEAAAVEILYAEGSFLLQVKDGKMEYPAWTVRPQDAGEDLPKRIVLALTREEEALLRGWIIKRKALELKTKGAAEMELQRAPEHFLRVRLDGKTRELSWWDDPRCEGLAPLGDSLLALCDGIARGKGKPEPSGILWTVPKPPIPNSEEGGWPKGGTEMDGLSIALRIDRKELDAGESVKGRIRIENRTDKPRKLKIVSDGLEGSFRLLVESADGEKGGSQGRGRHGDPAIGYFANRNAGPTERTLEIPAGGTVEEAVDDFLGIRDGKAGIQEPLPPGRYRLVAVLGDRFPPWKLERPSEVRSNPVEIVLGEPK